MLKCPMCGYQEVIEGKRATSLMNHYVNKDNPEQVVILNGHEDTIVAKSADGKVSVTWVKQEVWDAKMAQTPPTPKAPASEVTPTIANQAPNPFASKQ